MRADRPARRRTSPPQPDRRADGTGVYPIRAVARLTGLGIDTIRAWERRHAAVTPARDDRGRTYSDADIERLRLLRDAVAAGHSIGHVAPLDNARLRHLAHQQPAPSATARQAPPAVAAAAGAAALESLIDAIVTFDRARLDAELGRAAATLRPAALLRDVLVPLLHRVGDDWHAGRLSVAHEHFASAAVRGVMGTLLRALPPAAGAARLVFATPTGEHHELGALGAALLAASGGLAAVYLGPDVPADDLVTSARDCDARAVVLGITAATAAGRPLPDVARLVRRLPAATELWLGGRRVAGVRGRTPARVRLLHDYDDLERELVRVGARF